MKTANIILVSFFSIVLIGAIWFGALAHKDDIAYHIAGYKVDHNGVVIYKDVKNMFNINETSKDGVNVNISLYPDSTFYDFPHDYQLMKAKDVNGYAKRMIKNGNVIDKEIVDVDGTITSMGWRPISGEYSSTVVSKIYDQASMIINLTFEGMRVKYHKWNAPWKKDVEIDYIHQKNWSLDSIKSKYYVKDSIKAPIHGKTIYIPTTIRINSVEELYEFKKDKEAFIKKHIKIGNN